MRKVLLSLTVVAGVLVAQSGTGAGAASLGELSGTARLVSGAAVVPGQARQFGVDVANTSQPELLVLGERINYVSIIFPTVAGVTTNPDVKAPSGWTVHVTDSGSLQRLTFRTDSSSIEPGESMAFEFPGDVAAPREGDKSGEFRVSVSSDGGQTTEPASGELSTVVKVLEVTHLAALSPRGVDDQIATGGQSISYGMRVRNHAQQTLRATPTLSSDHAEDAVGSATGMPISSGRTRTFEFPVTLGPESGERTSTFSGGATAGSASAVTEAAGLTVQAPPALELDPDSFTPKHVRADAPIRYSFRVNANKSNPPALTVDTCTLSFAGTAATLSESVEFGAGSAAQTLTFKPTRIRGEEGAHTVRVSCEGVDENDERLSFDLTGRDLVEVDHTPPLIDLDLEIPPDQTAVKSGDTLIIRGTVDEDADLDFVRLRTDADEAFPCTASSPHDFRCELRPNFAAGTTRVLAEAQATDRAGNSGGAASDPVEVDLLPPKLVVARTLSSRQLLVRFEEQNVIRGGCDPTQWAVDGHVVARVLFSNGDECTVPLHEPGQSGPSGAPNNFRILVLSDELESRDETPVVRYSRSVAEHIGDDIHDGALNVARTGEVTAMPGILPPAPELVAVTRTDSAGSTGREPAVKSGEGTKLGTDTYWTNQLGDDLRVEFTGARKGYQVQAVDGNGDAVSDPQVVTSDSGGGVITVPIGDLDQRYVRGIRLINAAGEGDPAYFDVVLDRVAPAISDAAADGDQVTVSFTKMLAFGSDFANDWYAWERVPGGREYYQAQRVDSTGDDSERVLAVPFEGHGEFGGVDYIFTSTGPGAARYEDRAGNQLPDTTSFTESGDESGEETNDADGGGGEPTSEEVKLASTQTDNGAQRDDLAVTGAPIDDMLLLATALVGLGIVALAGACPAPAARGKHRRVS